MILADNTFYHGGVLDETNDEANAAALRAFNDKLAADRRVVCALTTIRDGVTIIRRVGD